MGEYEKKVLTIFEAEWCCQCSDCLLKEARREQGISVGNEKGD